MLLNVVIWILLIWLAIPVLYFLIFAMASLRHGRQPVLSQERQMDFVLLIPAYHSDSSICQTARAALEQNYPKDKFRVLVISDGMREQTVTELRNIGVEVLEVSFENSTKAKSLERAACFLGEGAADSVVILDADNIVDAGFLSAVNSAMSAGAGAVQAHRMAKNTDTDVALIDAVSEEINNSIFRKGHNALGISAALTGSGMAFSYDWFYENASSFITAGEDKEMELALLRDGIFVEYLDNVPVLDEKTRDSGNYYNQHRRWTASQYHLMGGALKKTGLVKDMIGYMDKLFQWCLPPRMIVVFMVPFMAIVLTIFGHYTQWEWWILTAMMMTGMLVATPSQYMNSRMLKALCKVPLLSMMSFANLFRMKGTKDKFIHTEHE